MNFLRDLGQDLVDKRLWPIAVLLCVALIAVPVVLSSDPEAPGSSGAAAFGPGEETAQAVSLDQSQRGRLTLDGSRNPFARASGLGAPGADAAGGSTQPAEGSSTAPDTASGDPGAGASGGETGGSTTGDTGSDGTSAVPAVPRPGTMAWVLELRFGPADAQRRVTLLPGRALPSNSDPILIYLGTPDGGKTARFLVSSDAVPQGDGSCQPSRRACEELTMRAGQTAFFDVASGTGSEQYQLDLAGIVRKRV